ncbi:prepilin-type N-terminal cleavage/methylation domain-containing protein [Thiomicrospira microaerophila]|uniref:prepilin-type N-terminal cleavage/methylation domain-containing protein n=1 Tax=Thiomicrospira microaerophila TaxID=406020 RepID=UPI00200CD81B|nr:prepilin-type N-terminal cleavage/methylation domain-containing protein [Thiomicrospira microaerophila]UQB43182.1 prepilin-type N-terminal cleavage/methylation domain-containing protein [Thiomicrospira microaerophila]
MHKYNTSNQSGFSLLEIALVLIILGLLVSGAIKGVALIDNSRVKSLVSDAKNYPIAIISYESTFGSLFDTVTNPNNIPNSSEEMRLQLVNRNLVANKPEHSLRGQVLILKNRLDAADTNGNVTNLAFNDNATPKFFPWALCFTRLEKEDDVRGIIRNLEGDSVRFTGDQNNFNNGRARLVDSNFQAVSDFASSNQTLCIAVDTLL